ncbi:MAG: UvrD-helicase domain-containing protein [Planctomycetia bacterium]|jgi:exodeoxyribonuclease V beta subunit
MNLDLATDPFTHGLVVEASAGTGKTYAVAALVTRELALREDLRIGQILITTFTQNAAAELRDRVRRRIAETTAVLRGGPPPAADLVATALANAAPAEVAARVRRLERALVEFDAATISTIHGVCSRVLRAAGVEMGTITDADEAERIVAEVVNDLVVTRSTAEQCWDESRIRRLVMAKRDDPLLELWFDGAHADLTAAARQRLEAVRDLVAACEERIDAALSGAPGYGDLLRIARQAVCDAPRPEVLAGLRQRFRLAIIDEAQDTDRQQWMIFRGIFPGLDDGRALVSVGDPKQAIYGFRGADVRAYVDQAGQAKRDAATRAKLYRTLPVNRRSDAPLLAAVNAAFAGQTFGPGIEYLDVAAAPGREAAGIRNMPASVEFVELPGATRQVALVDPVVGKVIEILDDARLATPDEPVPGVRPVEPRDICILVRSSGVGRLVERALARTNIPAVMGGTSSVMKSAMALDVRSLLEACAQPWNVGRVRRAAATLFIGRSLADVCGLGDDVLVEIQDRLMTLSRLLVTKGLAAFGAAVEADEATMARIAAGRHGERNVTDFLHVIEVMNAQAPGRGRTPEQALEIFSHLAGIDEKHDLVSRRVESDADAVRILTIHAAKGLEFPCVIVADLWKESAAAPGRPTVFYDDDGIRKLDIGFALDIDTGHARRRRQAADDEETRRLLYVACTRARNYLCVVVARGLADRQGGPPRLSILEQTMTLPAVCARPNGRMRLTRTLAAAAATDRLTVAPAPAVTTTYRRTSFTSLTGGRGHERGNPFAPEGGGYDEPSAAGELPAPTPAAASATLPVIDLPAGVGVGRVIHEIFEHVDTACRPLVDEVRRVVRERATAGRLRSCHDELVGVVTDTLETPLGGPFGAVSLAVVPPHDRLAEMTFEMGLAAVGRGVRVNVIGAVLAETIAADDPLRPYAETLAGAAFDLELGGLLNGSIDALLRLPGSTPDRPRLLLCDYKSNRLHHAAMADPLQAYAPERLTAAMEANHYPLQALLYGAAVWRMLRWRLPEADADACIAGVAYAFIRGMKGPATPVDGRGHRYGVFAWEPPRGLWRRLSAALMTPRMTGGSR